MERWTGLGGEGRDGGLRVQFEGREGKGGDSGLDGLIRDGD